jgi:AraC family transcriptional regulator, regulatory protein of adaptative response / methylphosphotriester-DNA alkyltransferase methyltransferase
MNSIESVNVSFRQRQIVDQYLHELDSHLIQLKSGHAERSLEIRDLAEKLHLHPRHLSNTIYKVLGVSPCDLYEEKLILIAKQLLKESDMPIAIIAHRLDFDPSNFTKFFKRYTSITPKAFRKAANFTTI